MPKLFFSSLILVIPILLTSLSANAGTRVEIVALFKEKAVLLINGTERLLKVGNTSPEGVTLLGANHRVAHLEWEGGRRLLPLSQKISSAYVESPQVSVTINRSQQGHYFTTGDINGKPVRFVVDTGANVLALNSRDASMLGIDYVGKGQRSLVETASGSVAGYSVNISEVVVGGIKVNNVKATVLEGAYPRDILLGMAFLEHVNMEEANGVMLLHKKY